jgi:large subunit ribosomal protein L16
MLSPKKLKYKKSQKGRRRQVGLASRKINLAFGEFGLKSLESAWITANQIEAARRAISRFLKKGGKFWIRIFPDKPVTVKSAETPMGGGKGSVDHYVAAIKKGTILFELTGVEEEVAREAFRLASHKLPVKTKFIKK